MTPYNKVIWSEGLFLRPQHMQQQERYFERFVELRAGALRPHAWGFAELELEQALLSIGKLAIRRARGCFPDGTPFSIPDRDPSPPPLEVPGDCRDQVVSLALPLRASAQPDSEWPDTGPARLVRYRVDEAEVGDASGGVPGTVRLEVGAMASRLRLQSQPGEGLVEVPMARIVECRADRRVILDDGFIPSASRIEAAAWLTTFLSELLGLLHQRGQALAGRVGGSERGGVAEISDVLMLQVVNRYQPLVAHWAAAPLEHPERLYRLLLEMAGELATFTHASRRSGTFPAYRHEALRESFEPVVLALRESLSAVLEQSAIAVPLQQRKYGVWVGLLPDPSLLDTAAFVLAVKADLRGEELRKRLPGESKIGPVEKIRDLVNLQLPGIGVAPMAVAPRQVPYHAGCTYFELDRQAPLWKSLRSSGGMALHFGGGFPGLELELWAVRN
ncbi:type VI secretion system baseplate subunit TssK [Xanthomonas translucens pv. translucens]|uniref:type VI secretion system baseplate subunit TssK n=1 Tax=Xanthomonas campestris pv. translucens TaxID=343 RepID=UPI0012977A55|nr:type VI secretion system baseplate subunit TssK [Xanthomonas translucens]MQS42285.1 type VI secretion system baseplate subunit TssK [Xanthomonas translucens pv. translucens]